MFARSLRTGLAALVLTLTAVPTFAFADTTTPLPRTEHVKEGKEKAAWPMPAAKFDEMVEGRITKQRAHLVDRMKDAKLPDEKREARLAKFDRGSETIMAEVKKVSANGTVTREGAREVAKVTWRVRGHHKNVAKGHGKEARRDHKDANKNVGHS